MALDTLQAGIEGRAKMAHNASPLKRRVGVLAGMVGQLLCLLGFHDFKVIDATIGFGLAGGTSTVQCQRCGRVITHSN